MKWLSRRKKLILIKILGFLASALPLVITLVSRWDLYVAHRGDGLKLTFGLVLIVACLGLKAMGKIHLSSAIAVYTFLLVISYLMESMIQDLQLISLMALIGEIADTCVFGTWAKREKKKVEMDEQGDVTTEKLETVLQSYLGGRV